MAVTQLTIELTAPPFILEICFDDNFEEFGKLLASFFSLFMVKI